MSREKEIEVIREYLKRSFAGVNISHQDDFSPESHSFKVKSKGGSLLLSVTEDFMDLHTLETLDAYLNGNHVAEKMREHPGKIVVIMTTGITIQDRF